MGIYYRSALSREQLRIYDAIAEGVAAWKAEIPVGRCSLDGAMKMYSLVLLDNPELFHALPQVRARGNGWSSTVMPEYAFDRRVANARWAVIDAHVHDYKQGLAPVASDYEKAEAAYDYIIKLCEYGHSPDDQNMCSVLVDEVSCCTGYSKAFAYLLSTVGVRAPVVTGKSRSSARGSGPHAWNAVCLDGRWSWVDSTWGDPISVSGAKRLSEVSYDYLCVPERELSSSHFVSPDIAGLLPRCDSDGDSWYSRHNLLFPSYEPEIVGRALQGDVLAREIGFGRDMDGDAYAKFSTRKGYEDAVEHLCRKLAVAGMLSPVYAAYGYSISNFSYSLNEDMLTVHIRYDIMKNI